MSVDPPQNWSQFFLCMLLLHTTIVVVVGQIMTGRRLLESPVPSFSVILSLAGAQCSAPLLVSLLALSLFISCQIICVALCIFFGASYRTLYGIRSSFRVVFFSPVRRIMSYMIVCSYSKSRDVLRL